MFDVYKITRKNGFVFWAVCGYDENNNPKKYNPEFYDKYGDELFDTEEDALTRSELEKKLYSQRFEDEKNAAKESEAKKNEANDIESIYKNYTSKMTLLQKSNVVKRLQKRINFNADGGPLTIEQFISTRKEIKLRVEHQGNKNIYIVNDYMLGKIAYDYALYIYLIKSNY